MEILYFSEISKIWKIEDIESWLNKNNSSSDLPKKILVTDQLPSDKWHGWKWLKHDEARRPYTLMLELHAIFVYHENSQYASF